eukprot:jgi/Antlo1/1380/1223
MKLIKNEIENRSKKGSVEITVEKTVDIYMLYNLVEAGDQIKTHTCRKIALEGTGIQKKVTLLMEIKVEDSVLNIEYSRLYFKGKILSEHENVKKGAYHTIEVEPGNRLRVTKSEWTAVSLVILHKMQNTNFDMLFVILYDKLVEMLFFSCGLINRTQKIAAKGRSYRAVFECLERNIEGAKKIVIVTFTDDDKKQFSMQLAEFKGLASHTKFFCYAQLDKEMKGLNGRKLAAQILTEQRYLDMLRIPVLENEVRKVCIFNKNFYKTPGLVCVGIDEIFDAVEYGAVKDVLVTYETHRKLSLEDRDRLDSMISLTKSMGGSIVVIPEMHVAGQQLKDIGGIAANLKFEYRSQ